MLCPIDAHKLEKASAGADAEWRAAVAVAIAETKRSVRILVTAPKVSINIGRDEVNIQKGMPREVELIRSIVGDQVLPRFQQILAVSEERGDADVRAMVTGLVEELATSVQREVKRVLPQAEGTASWDGFGSRSASVTG